MANYRAVNSGDFSNLATWEDNSTGSFIASTVLPGVNDDVYANQRSVTIDINVNVRSIRNNNVAGILSGGGFVVNINGLTITASVSIGSNGLSNNVNCITVNLNGSDTCTIVTGAITSGDVFANGIVLAGTGILNITCSTSTGQNASTGRGVVNNSSGTINFTGTPIGGTQGAGLANASTGTVYITGVPVGFSGPQVGGPAVTNGAGSLYITGGATSGDKQPGVSSSSNGYIKIIGPVISNGVAAVVSSGGNAINILTGPFISSPNGVLPISIFRMHYEITSNSYYEFRDSSTNGAGTAPPTKLVAPNTAVDSPNPVDVRNGVVYAFNTLTGTLVVPNPANVASGVPTDNTVGTAALTPADFWDYLTSGATPGSMGARVAAIPTNPASVESTGAQIASFNT
jgi:hypothetical protein